MKEKKIILNRGKCNKCDDVITSYHIHDYVTCKCGAIAVDGGTEYLKRTGEISDLTELSIDTSSPFKIIRDNYHRGGRGKNGDEQLKWVPMSKMSDNWLLACIKYNNDRGLEKSFANKMYKKELKYRQKNKITIEE